MDTSNRKANQVPEDSSVGRLLRRAREEGHIDLNEAVEATRIRRYYLEALEKEQWGKLPSPVFIKGFLRAYAEFLGLDKEMVLNSYLRSYPSQEHELRGLKELTVKSRSWHLTIIISVLALALIVSIIHLKGRNISIIAKTFQYLERQDPVEREEDKEVQADKLEDIFPPRDEGVVGKEEKAVLAPKSSEETAIPEEPIPKETEKVVGKEEKAVLEPKSSEEIAIPEEPTIPKETKDEKPLRPQFILTATVKSQTWIAMYIDDEAAKEYLLEPGDAMRWEADEGFDILVGNAGGIEFFLNGEEVGHLGPEGKVVRLKLPEGT